MNFYCDNSQRCIDSSMECDDFDDCTDRSDEHPDRRHICDLHSSFFYRMQISSAACVKHICVNLLSRWHRTTGSASDQQSTNDWKVAGSRPTKVVCIKVLTGNRMWWTARCGRSPLLFPSCKKLEFRLSALMDSDLAWLNGKSGRQSWRYADAFQRSIISEAIYHLHTQSKSVIE